MEIPEGVKKRIGAGTLGLAILVLIALLFIIGSVLFATDFVKDTVDFAVQNLAERSGLSVFLVKGVVILFTIPFFWLSGNSQRTSGD